MSQPDSDRSSSGSGESSRRILSALADGDATDSEAARAFQAWRDDPDARAAWHSYQLIGDVLRSDDLAVEPAALPVAAHASVAGGRSRSRWQGPVAMAAGFLVVIGGLNIVRPFGHGGAGTLATNGAAASGPVLASTTSVNNSGIVATSLQTTPAQTPAQTQAAADQLAPYLAAHRQSSMSGPFQMPGSDLRNASLVQPAR